MMCQPQAMSKFFIFGKGDWDKLGIKIFFFFLIDSIIE